MEVSSPKPGRPAVILLASNEEWTSRALDSVLGQAGHAVLRARSGINVLDLARATAPDAFLLDSALRDVDALDTCARIRSELGPGTPVLIFSSSAVGRPERVKALTAGAWAVLNHPIDGETLVLQLKTFLASKAASDAIRELNMLDGSTGLYSARGLARRAREIGAEAIRLRTPLACVAVTALADNGDQISTAVLSADQLTAHVASVLARFGRVSDAIGRVGDSEIGLVAPATDAAGAERMVSRLQQSLVRSPLRFDGRELPVQIRVSFRAVDNFAESTIDAMEMLVRASGSLRSAQPHTSAIAGSRASDPDPSLPS
jgi:PleD family two-component response regulator